MTGQQVVHTEMNLLSMTNIAASKGICGEHCSCKDQCSEPLACFLASLPFNVGQLMDRPVAKEREGVVNLCRCSEAIHPSIYRKQ